MFKKIIPLLFFLLPGLLCAQTQTQQPQFKEYSINLKTNGEGVFFPYSERVDVYASFTDTKGKEATATVLQDVWLKAAGKETKIQTANLLLDAAQAGKLAAFEKGAKNISYYIAVRYFAGADILGPQGLINPPKGQLRYSSNICRECSLFVLKTKPQDALLFTAGDKIDILTVKESAQQGTTLKERAVSALLSDAKVVGVHKVKGGAVYILLETLSYTIPFLTADGLDDIKLLLSSTKESPQQGINNYPVSFNYFSLQEEK